MKCYECYIDRPTNGSPLKIEVDLDDSNIIDVDTPEFTPSGGTIIEEADPCGSLGPTRSIEFSLCKQTPLSDKDVFMIECPPPRASGAPHDYDKVIVMVQVRFNPGGDESINEFVQNILKDMRDIIDKGAQFTPPLLCDQLGNEKFFTKLKEKVQYLQHFLGRIDMKPNVPRETT